MYTMYSVHVHVKRAVHFDCASSSSSSRFASGYTCRYIDVYTANLMRNSTKQQNFNNTCTMKTTKANKSHRSGILNQTLTCIAYMCVDIGILSS